MTSSDLNAKLAALIQSHIDGTVDAEKRSQYAEARRNQAYWRGNQYLVPMTYDNYAVDWRTVTGALKAPGATPEGAYDYVRNQIRGDGKKLCAVLGQHSPNVTAVADNPEDESAVRQAREANRWLARLRTLWDVERVQRRLPQSLWLYGTTFGRVEWVANARKYGTRKEPVYDTVEVPMPGGFQCSACATQSPEMGQCPGCGKFLQPSEALPPTMVPQTQVVGDREYARGAPELTLESILRVTTPFYSLGVETLPWLTVEWSEHQAIILDAYNDGNHDEAMKMLWEMRNSSGTGALPLSDAGKAARTAVSSQYSQHETRSDIWDYRLVYMRPAMFMYLEDGLRQEMFRAYPKGLRVTLVEGKVIDLVECDLSEVWSECFPEPNESMFPDPLCKDYMHAQDLINDLLNITAETAERGIGFTVYDPQVLSKEYFKNNPGSPGELIPSVSGAGHHIKDAFYSPPRPELSGDLIQWQDAVIAAARENVGVQPALFGGEAAVPTAYQASRQLNQALAQLSPVWNEIRSFWRKTFMNGLKSLARFDPDAADLQFDRWHLEVEEPIPMTWGQKRDYVMMLLDRNPAAWSLMGLTHPANLSIVNTALGMQGWVVPNEREREAALDTIRELLQAQPIQLPPQTNPMTGAMIPSQPQPSIPPDDLELLPQLVVDVVREWLASDEGRDAKRQNPSGYANVLAWGRAFLQMTLPPPQPPAPGGAGPGPAPDAPPQQEPVPGGQPLPQGASDMLQPVPPAPPSVAQPQ